ncbi:MAG: dicarboxylate/amino acid:cation symporter [Gemmatimonadaceae bacterium]
MTTATTPRRPFLGQSLTTWSLVALAAGLALGIIGHAAGSGTFGALGKAIEPIGAVWVAALQMLVLPLVLTHVLAAIVVSNRNESVGALGAWSVLLFVGMLVIAGIFTLALAPPIISSFTVAPETVASLRAATTVPETARHAESTGHGSFYEWLAGLVPTNLFAAAVRGDVLPLLLFSVVLGIAITRLPAGQREPLGQVFRSLAEAMLLLVRWVLWGTPVAVFVLSYALALEGGGAAAGVLAAWVAIVSLLLVLFTALLYPWSAILGRTTIRTFARSVAPAQLIALSTRSSIAALPALVEGGREHLRLPATATSFVLPLSVSVFKVNRTISSTAKLLFLAHVFGVPLGVGTLATFLVTVIILSFTSAGVPLGGSAFKTLPAYVAAGVPIEAVVILEAVETIPDIFKTVLNVTGDMSVAALLTRSGRALSSMAPTADESKHVTETA